MDVKSQFNDAVQASERIINLVLSGTTNAIRDLENHIWWQAALIGQFQSKAAQHREQFLVVVQVIYRSSGPSQCTRHCAQERASNKDFFTGRGYFEAAVGLYEFQQSLPKELPG